MAENEAEIKKAVQISPSEYNKILGKLELDQIALRSISAELRTPKVYLNKAMHGKISHDVGFDIKENHVSFFIKYIVVMREEKKAKIALKIVTSYEAAFKCKELRLTKEFCEVYAERNLQFNIWPFLREIIYSTTSKMNIPPITLPLVKLSGRFV